MGKVYEFIDWNPENPTPITGERHIIEDGKIRLNHAPLKGSVVIQGFSEDSTGFTPSGTFFIRYGESDNYRTADQYVHFNPEANGLLVTVSYQAVSTLIRAEHFNEINRFMELGVQEIVAKMLIEHEERMAARWETMLETHCKHIVAAIKSTINGIDPDMIADDDDADAMLDEFFPGDVEPTEKTSETATNEEADTMLDEYFYTPPDEESEDGTGITEVASDEEFEAMLDETLPEVSHI